MGALLAGVLVVGACSAEPAVEPNTAPTTRTPTTVTTPLNPPTLTATPRPGPVVPAGITEIATGLDAPWSIAFLPDGSALVSQRDAATIVHVAAGGGITEVGPVPGVNGGGEGGLLGLALDPAAPTTLYVYATMGDDNRVLRTTYTGGALGEFETILDGIPAAGNHNGGRLRFGPDGLLYVSTGDAGDGSRSQDLDSLGGKILRMTPDGAAPPDNPFAGSLVYSYGHRNVQGLAFDDDGTLWASEFGNQRLDELNRITPGGNYGWPIVEGIAGDQRFTDPQVDWPTSEASPSGLAYASDTFFLAGLRGQRLWQVPAPEGVVGEPAAFVADRGRLRDAVVAPDGALWVLTNNTDGRGDPRPGDDRILRVELEPQG